MRYSIEEWEENLSRVEEITAIVYGMKGTLANDADTLMTVIDLMDESFGMDNNMVTGDKAMDDRYMSAIIDRKSKWEYIIPEVEAIGRKKIKEFMRQNKRLKRMKKWFGRIFTDQRIREQNRSKRYWNKVK